MKPEAPFDLQLSGERFHVLYSIWGSEAEATACAKAMTIEETVEYPEDVLPDGDIREKMTGQVEDISHAEDQRWSVEISYAVETTSFELLQFLNVVYGNISMITNIRAESFTLPPSLARCFKGPRLGKNGLRAQLGVPERAITATATKPMGLSSKVLAKMAYDYALGGLDIVKDDHGLSDQRFAPFQERVRLCADAVAEANAKTGGKCIYFPSVTAPADQVKERAYFAKEVGAGGLCIIPSLIGWDTTRMLAEDDALGLPIICHPSFHGAYSMYRRGGFSAHILYALLPRLIGADISIFPNYIGRFSGTLEDCQSTLRGCADPMGHIQSCFGAAGGGVTLNTLPELSTQYGHDIVYLIGGGLHHGDSLVESCRAFRHFVDTH